MNTKPLNEFKSDAERIYVLWDDALAHKDVEAMLVLYREDAILESPLVAHLLQQESGVCVGKSEIKKLLEILFTCQPEKRRFYRNPLYTSGNYLIWEYPRISPEGEQMDFTEVMELKEGLIYRHRVYWGWCGVNIIKSNLHHELKKQNLDKH